MSPEEKFEKIKRLIKEEMGPDKPDRSMEHDFLLVRRALMAAALSAVALSEDEEVVFSTLGIAILGDMGRNLKLWDKSGEGMTRE